MISAYAKKELEGASPGTRAFQDARLALLQRRAQDFGYPVYRWTDADVEYLEIEFGPLAEAGEEAEERFRSFVLALERERLGWPLFEVDTPKEGLLVASLPAQEPTYEVRGEGFAPTREQVLAREKRLAESARLPARPEAASSLP